MYKKIFSIFILTLILLGAGGLPAAHGIYGSDFGSAVSGWAENDPAEFVDHVVGSVVPEIE